MDGGRHEAKEAETAVLGAFSTDPNAFDRVSEFITGPDFFSPRHQLIFQHMSELREEGLPIDTVTLAPLLSNPPISKLLVGWIIC